MSKKFDPQTLIKEHLETSAKVKGLVLANCAGQIEAAANLVVASFKKGGKLLLCGNGGSAADCQHFAAEFVSRLTKDFIRPALPALALTTDTSFLTAFANDCGYEGVFARQIEAIGKGEDVLVGISTSGSSGNVVKGVEAARTKGMKVIVFCGEGGSLPGMADVAICVPSKVTQYIQESHLAIEHLICAIVERKLYPENL